MPDRTGRGVGFSNDTDLLVCKAPFCLLILGNFEPSSEPGIALSTWGHHVLLSTGGLMGKDDPPSQIKELRPEGVMFKVSFKVIQQGSS